MEKIRIKMKTKFFAVKVLGITGIVLNSLFVIGTLIACIHLWGAKMACTFATVVSALFLQAEPCQYVLPTLDILCYTTMVELSLEEM